MFSVFKYLQILSIHDLNPIYRADTQNNTVNIKQQSQDQLVQAQISSQSCRANSPKGQTLVSNYVHVDLLACVCDAELHSLEFINV